MIGCSVIGNARMSLGFARVAARNRRAIGITVGYACRHISWTGIDVVQGAGKAADAAHVCQPFAPRDLEVSA